MPFDVCLGHFLFFTEFDVGLDMSQKCSSGEATC